MHQIINMGPNGSGLLTKNAAERMVNLYEATGKGQDDERKFGPGFWDAYKGIHAAEGNPKRITDPSQIYSDCARPLSPALGHRNHVRQSQEQGRRARSKKQPS